ncbi:MAG: glycosyltransferase, partial [Fusobacteriaceae bacterium]
MVAVSRLVKGKGREDLIEIYSNLKRRGIVEKLCILGEGPEYENLKKLIKFHELEEDVFLLGQRSNPYIWMKGAKLFLHTSYGEGLPTVMIESMINNCPIIAYDSPTGPKEILGEGKYGILIEMGDRKKFEESVYALLKNLKLREGYRERFLEQISNFDKKNIVEQLKNIV